MSDSRRRLTAVILALVVVASASAADAEVARAPQAGPQESPASAMIAGPSAVTSAWYCAGSAAAPSGTAATVVLTNSGPRTVSAEMTATAPTTDSVNLPAAPSQFDLSVPPAGQEKVVLASAQAAELFLNGGAVVAQEILSGPAGWSVAPCVSSPSTSWYFAQGSTAGGSSLSLTLLNPTATPAVADVSFVSHGSGLIEPPAFQGIPIAAGAAVVETVSDHVNSDPSIATVVTTLSGSVVAAEVEVPAGGKAPSVLNGVAAPTQDASFPLNALASGGSVDYTVFNPSAQGEMVKAEFAFPSGKSSPLVMRVSAMSTVVVSAQSQTRIPAATPYAVTFSSPDGPGVVVEREVVAPPGATAPAGGSTDGFTVAQPGGAQRWLVPAVTEPGTGVQSMAVVNVAGRTVHVTLESFDGHGRLHPVALGGTIVLAPGAMAVPITWSKPPVGAEVLEVVASGPVAVELDPTPTGAQGAVVTAVFEVTGR